MKLTLLALVTFSLTACATATRMHTACDVKRFAWANLEPPLNSSELKVLGNVGPPKPSDSEIWFGDKQGSLLLCRVDLRYQCGSVQRWTFDLDGGQWAVAPYSGVPDLCTLN